MNKADRELVDESLEMALDEAAVVSTDNAPDLPESPASVNVKFWIKGYGVMFTMRDEKVNPLLKKLVHLVEYAESHGWKNVWDKEQGFQPSRGSTHSEKVSQEECQHANIGQKKSSGYNKPENKDRIYSYCLDCNKFIGWVK